MRPFKTENCRKRLHKYGLAYQNKEVDFLDNETVKLL